MNEIKLHIIPGMGRQGDVLIMPSLKPFEEADLGKPIMEGDNQVTLALGEITGHAHAFYPERDIAEGLVVANDADVRARVTLYPLSNIEKYCVTSFKEGVRALRLISRAFLRHEDHTYHSFPAGDYVVIQQHVGNELEEIHHATD